MLETLDYTIRIGITPMFLYFDLYFTLPKQHTTFSKISNDISFNFQFSAR